MDISPIVVEPAWLVVGCNFVGATSVLVVGGCSGLEVTSVLVHDESLQSTSVVFSDGVVGFGRFVAKLVKLIINELLVRKQDMRYRQ